MQHKLTLTGLLVMALFAATVPAALGTSTTTSTTWYVDGINGSDSNSCTAPTAACKTIGHALSLAHSSDSIKVAAATYTENLTIGHSLKITGVSAQTTIIDGGGVNTVVTISSGNNVTLSNFTIRNGSTSGIINGATLTIKNSTVSGNQAHLHCVGLQCFAYGGGIYNGGRMTINASTISGNNAFVSCPQNHSCTFSGGGIANFGMLALTIINSTISGNTAGDGSSASPGAGIYNQAGTVAVSSSTIDGNFAGGISSPGGKVTLQNSIVASNAGGNCSGAGVSSNGYNLSSDNTCNLSNAGDMNNVDPILGPLQNNGGPTQTMAVTSGSPAIDAGNPLGCTDSHGNLLKTDQRGMPRRDSEDSVGCDLGAYESLGD
jgi:hypothetical protein